MIEFHHGDPLMVDYVPGADTAAGTLVTIGTAIAITHRDIKANELGAAATSDGNGVYRAPIASGKAFTVGAAVQILAGEATDTGGTAVGWAVRPADEAAGDTHVAFVFTV